MKPLPFEDFLPTWGVEPDDPEVMTEDRITALREKMIATFQGTLGGEQQGSQLRPKEG